MAKRAPTRRKAPKTRRGRSRPRKLVTRRSRSRAPRRPLREETASGPGTVPEVASPRRGARLHPIIVSVNGTREERSVEPRQLLVDFLRDDLGLTGTHVGCDTSHCGACTVLVDGRAVKSCTMFAVQADGSDIVTIEGLAAGGRLHPLQEAFLENQGLQCGYCTPGVVLAAVAFLKENPSPDEDAIRIAISGNLCRCTGYQNIVRSVAAAAAKMAADGGASP